MLKIEIYNHEVTQASIDGDSDEITTDLGLIMDTVLFKISEAREDQEEILDNLVSKIKEVWKEIDEGGQADA